MTNNRISKEFYDLLTEVKKYLDARYDLAKIDFIEKLVLVASSVIVAIIIGLFLLTFVLFISIAFAFYLGTLMKETYLGFLTVAGIYMLLSILGFAFRKHIFAKPIIKSILRKIFNNEEDRNDDED